MLGRNPTGTALSHETVSSPCTAPGQEGVNAHSACSSQGEGRLGQPETSPPGGQPPRQPPPTPKKSPGCIRTETCFHFTFTLKEIHPSVPEFMFHSTKVIIIQNKSSIQTQLTWLRL